MEHVVVFIDILLLCFGGSGIVSLFLLHKRYRDVFTRNLVIVNALFTAILFLQLGSVYIVTFFPGLDGALRMLFPLSFLLGVGVYIGIARTVMGMRGARKPLLAVGAAAVVLIMCWRLYLSLGATEHMREIFRFPTTAGISVFLFIVGWEMRRTSSSFVEKAIQKLSFHLSILTIVFSIVSTVFYFFRQRIPGLSRLPVSLDYLYFFVWSVISLYTFLGDTKNENDSGTFKRAGNEFMMKYAVTPRELEVVNCIADGMSNKEIADKLCVSFTTVRSHVYNIFQKTGAKSRLDLLKKVQAVEIPGE